MNKTFERTPFLGVVALFLLCAVCSSCSDDESSDANIAKPGDAAVESARTIVGFVNRGQYNVGSEVVLREVDSTLALTGYAYHTTVDDSSGRFTFENVKLTQPYVYIEVNGAANPLCYESGPNQSQVRREAQAYADIRKGDTISVNLLTHMQAKRLKLYMDRGLSFDSSMSELQKELSDFFLLDSLQRDFNKLNLATEQADNYYLLGATVLDEGFLYLAQSFEDLLKQEVITDSMMTPSWSIAYGFSHNEDCFKYKENVKKFGYKAALTTGRKYLDNLWQKKYNLGQCSDNYHEIKAAASNKTVFLYCDTSGWTRSSNGCYGLDRINLENIAADTLPGKLVKATYCKDTYYRWDHEVGWTKATESDVAVGMACMQETEGRYGKGRGSCYKCTASSRYYWKEVDLGECDE